MADENNLNLFTRPDSSWDLALYKSFTLVKLIGKPEIRFTGFKPVTGLQNVLPVTEF